jgi:hypothetical protein
MWRLLTPKTITINSHHISNSKLVCLITMQESSLPSLHLPKSRTEIDKDKRSLYPALLFFVHLKTMYKFSLQCLLINSEVEECVSRLFPINSLPIVLPPLQPGTAFPLSCSFAKIYWSLLKYCLGQDPKPSPMWCTAWVDEPACFSLVTLSFLTEIS